MFKLGQHPLSQNNPLTHKCKPQIVRDVTHTDTRSKVNVITYLNQMQFQYRVQEGDRNSEET